MRMQLGRAKMREQEPCVSSPILYRLERGDVIQEIELLGSLQPE
jgi:hypothetical protein